MIDSLNVSASAAILIYEAIRQQIADGAFGTDGLLPSSRNLALELGVSRTTVTIGVSVLALMFARPAHDLAEGSARRPTGSAEWAAMALALAAVVLGFAAAPVLDLLSLPEVLVRDPIDGALP